MRYTDEKAGTSLPPRPNVDALISAIAHLEAAHRELDAQRTHHIKHLPEKARNRMYDRLGEVMQEVMEQYDNCCDILFLVLRPIGD